MTKIVSHNKGGVLTQDPSGTWHYFRSCQLSTVYEAIKFALDSNSPEYRPLCFWHSGVMCPVEPGDTKDSLLTRWKDWKPICRSEPLLMGALLHYTGIMTLVRE